MAKGLTVMLLIMTLICSSVAMADIWDERKATRQGRIDAENSFAALANPCEDLDGTERIRCEVENDVQPSNALACEGKRGNSFTECRQNFVDTKTCAKRPTFAGFDLCTRGVFQMKSSAVKDMTACAGDQQCITQLRDSYDTLILSRFYGLQERARQMNIDGQASNDAASTYIIRSEAAIQAYDDAKTLSEKVTIIRNLQQDWQAFKAAMATATTTTETQGEQQ